MIIISLTCSNNKQYAVIARADQIIATSYIAKYVNRPEKTSLNLSTQNTHIMHMVSISYFVCAKQNLSVIESLNGMLAI